MNKLKEDYILWNLQVFCFLLIYNQYSIDLYFKILLILQTTI